MWLVFSFQVVYELDLGYLGVYPRHLTGLIGLLTAPLIHGDLLHLVSNTIPLLFLGSVLFFFYPRLASNIFFRVYMLPYALVWLLSPRLSYHIGASGMVYGLSAFLIIYGLFKGYLVSLLISISTVFLYGGIFHGIMPTDPHISWETHLFGALTGALSAIQSLAKDRSKAPR
ncbi:MAG: rhomboid family intramembrane serine protease [Cyclobacteriaceae bacterium]|nr:rhomboid family intramembrane serine protease [Cyclobacteriaceae bacterium]